jgi:competence protein ComEA
MKMFLLVLFTALTFSIPAWAAVDINTATQSQLETLDGVGPKKAQAIIEYRKKNGAFKSVSDLDKVPGFGAKTVDKLKKDITVGNPKAAAAGKPDKVVKTAVPAAKPTAPAATPAKPAVPATKSAPSSKPAAMPAKAKQ